MNFIRLGKKILQFTSDIHLDYTTHFKFKSFGDYLALCGDIGNPFDNKYKNFINNIAKSHEKIFLISGNHEYFQNGKYNMNDVDNKINDVISPHKNVVFLNKNKEYCENYKIVGCTLWTSRSILSSDNKFITINNKPITIKEINHLHQEHKKFIIDNTTNSKNPIIILTHHIPSSKLIIDEYKNPPFDKYAELYSTDLEYIIKKPITAWLCGHSHSCINVNINNVFCAINTFVKK
jgi:predicted phosphohydrolase